jgi:hypothetical protein
MSEHQEIWCQPSDQPKRQFVVIFDDPQMDLATFDDEEEARSFWEEASINWNCYLLGTLPRDQSSKRHRHAEVVEEVRKVLGPIVEASAKSDAAMISANLPLAPDWDEAPTHITHGQLRAARALLSRLEER